MPEFIFSEPSTVVSITPSEEQSFYKDGNGISLSIPGNSFDKEQEIEFATSFSSAQKLPADVESASSTYIIRTNDMIEFEKDVDVSLQHAAYLETNEDCENMVVLQAAIGSKELQEMKGVKVKFNPKEQFGVIKLKRLYSSCIKIGGESESHLGSSKRQNLF